MTTIIVILVILLTVIIIVKPYVEKHDTCILYVGGLGSGKSLISVGQAKRLLHVNRTKVKIHNLLHPKDKQPIPLLYSTIPVRDGKGFSIPLNDLTPVLATKIVPRSVVFFDEVSLWLDQMTIKPANGASIAEFCTLFRHYTHGGYIVMNTQNTAKVNYNIRYCLNRGYHLAEFKKLWHVYWVKIRDLSLIDDEKSVNTGSLTENYRTKIGIIPFRKVYDTYCYSERVSPTPYQSTDSFQGYKVYHIARAPTQTVQPIVDDGQPYQPTATDNQPSLSALNNA